MKRITLLLLLFVTTIVTTTAAGKYQYEENRTIIKTISVGQRPIFESDTKYSDVIITHSAINEIQIKMVIKTSSNKKEWAQKMLDLPVFKVEKSGNGAYLYGSFDSELNEQHRNWGSFTISYYVSVPANTQFKCTSKYGGIDMDRVENSLSANIKYGNINIKNKISGSTSNFDMQYGDIKVLDASAPLQILIKYGNVKTGKCANIDIDSKYCNINIEQADQIKGIGKYDNYKIGSANSIIFSELDYTGLRINDLIQQISLSSFKYSSLKVNNVASGFKSINIPGAAYSDIKLRIPTRAFTINAETSYANIKIYDLYKAEKVRTTLGNSNSTINITNKYSDITITD